MTRRRLAQWVLGLFVAMLAVDAGTALGNQGQAGDTVEGAMWRMGLTSRAKKGMKRGTVFRVADGVLYQKVERKPDAEEQVVGKDRREGKTTILDFENLKVRDPAAPRGEGMETISGSARVELEEFGKWHGRFIDGDGRHWNVTLTRFKE